MKSASWMMIWKRNTHARSINAAEVAVIGKNCHRPYERARTSDKPAIIEGMRSLRSSR